MKFSIYSELQTWPWKTQQQVYAEALEQCVNPYGDGHTSPRVADILTRVRITPGLLAKWIASGDPLLD